MEICLVCSSDKDDNGLVICSSCDSVDFVPVDSNGRACGACGDFIVEIDTARHNCSEERTIQDRLMKVIEILKTPESSDEIWWCIGELETLIKDINSERKG